MNFGWLLTAIGASRMQALLETAPALATLALCALFVRHETDVALVFIGDEPHRLRSRTPSPSCFARRHGRHVRGLQLREVGQALRGGFHVFTLPSRLHGPQHRLGLSPGAAAFPAPTSATTRLADRLLSAAAGILQPIAVVLFPDSVRLLQARHRGWHRLKLHGGRPAGDRTSRPACAAAGLGDRPAGARWLRWVPKFAPSVPYFLLLVWALPFMAMSQMLVSCILYPMHRDVALARAGLHRSRRGLLGDRQPMALVPLTYGATGMAWLRLLHRGRAGAGPVPARAAARCGAIPAASLRRPRP